MKNKTIKNLISFGIFVFALFVATSASASYDYSNQYSNYNGYNSNYTNVNYGYGYGPSYGYNLPNYTQQPSQPSYNYTDPYYYINSQTTYGQQAQQTQYAQQSSQIQYVQLPTQYKYVQQPAPVVKYVQPQQNIQYVQQPAPAVKYVQPQQNIQYVQQPAQYQQAASVGQIQYAKSGTVQAKPVIAKVVSNGNTGAYVNYDNNYNPNLMGASAYGIYDSQPVNQIVTDNNGLTALSIGGSGGFMPSSLFQWFLVIILILAIIIIARMIGKTFSKTDHTTV